jgi:hypothetical protein
VGAGADGHGRGAAGGGGGAHQGTGRRRPQVRPDEAPAHEIRKSQATQMTLLVSSIRDGVAARCLLDLLQHGGADGCGCPSGCVVRRRAHWACLDLWLRRRAPRLACSIARSRTRTQRYGRHDRPRRGVGAGTDASRVGPQVRDLSRAALQRLAQQRCAGDMRKVGQCVRCAILAGHSHMPLTKGPCCPAAPGRGGRAGGAMVPGDGSRDDEPAARRGAGQDGDRRPHRRALSLRAVMDSFVRSRASTLHLL